MKDILEKLIDSLVSGNFFIGILIVVVALVFNYKKIVDFLEERKKAKITKLTEALKCEFITDLTKKHLQEELATEYFKITTGIGIEKHLREAVIKAHESTNGELAFIHFKRALPHLFFEENSFNVKVSTFDKMGYWFNLVFGFILAFVGLFLMVLPIQMNDFTLAQVITIFGLGCFFIAVCLFMLAQTFSVISANRIEDKLHKASYKKPIQPTANTSPG